MDLDSDSDDEITAEPTKINFTNNTRNADGKVNCVGFFNAGGDSFFNISEIELKIKELNEFLLNAVSIENKEKIKLFLLNKRDCFC